MKPSDSVTRRHRPHRSKPKPLPTTHILPAYGPNHVIAAPVSSRHAPSAHGNKENLVRGWLKDIHAHGSGLVAGDSHKPKDSNTKQTAHRPSPSPVRFAPHGLMLPESFGNAQSVPRQRGERRHKRRRASLDDSSVIAFQQHRIVPALVDDDRPTRRQRSSSAAQESYYGRGKRRREPDADQDGSGASLAPSPTHHKFEKRARYKTKSDRYDVVKHHDDGKKENKKGEKGAVVGSRKPKKKREHMASAREVMDNFNSHSILSERLTMPPSLRPGLFDNGRASKKHVPDLTFHEMAFLKQPRREPQQPLSRKRELENKRGEREREEVSAFFLHTNLPDRYDAKGRIQPDVSGLSSHGDKTGDTTSHSHEQRHAPGRAKFRPEKDNYAATVSDQTPHRQREGSKASTYISWSTSRPSPGSRLPSVSDARAPSSTPVYVRDALARTGIFDNTGIHYAGNLGYKSCRPGFLTRDNLASASPPPLKSQSPEHGAQRAPDQPVRIVRYQDRGTMAGEQCAGPGTPETNVKPRASPNASPNIQVGPLDISVAQQPEELASTTSTGEASGGRNGMTDVTNTEAHDTHAADPGISRHKKSPCCEVGPERPKAPKWMVIERLEALADLAKDAGPRWSSPVAPVVAPMNREPVRTASHSSSNLPQANSVSARTFPEVPIHPLGADRVGANRLALEPSLTLSQEHGSLLDPSNFRCPTSSGSILARGSAPYGTSQSQYAPATDYRDQSMSELPNRPQSASIVPTISSMQDCVYGAQQSMQDYIAEIEREVWVNPEESEMIWDSTLMEDRSIRHMEQPDFDGIGNGHSGNLQSHDDSVALPVDRADVYHPDRAPVADWDEDEDKIFMSSFWRPSGYPI